MTTGNLVTVRRVFGMQETHYVNQPPNIMTLTILQQAVGKVWSGSNDSGYKKKISQKVSATNNYTFTKTSIAYAHRAELLSYQPSWTGIRSYSLFSVGWGKPIPDLDANIVVDNTNVAMMKMYKKLDQLSTKVGGLEFLGEFRKTLKMIRRPAESLADYANKKAAKQVAFIKRHEANKARLKSEAYSKKFTNRSRKQLAAKLNKEQKSFTKLVASSILEFNFGAAPLIGELQAAAQAAVAIYPEKGSVKVLTTTSKQRVVISSKQRTSGGASAINEDFTDEYEYTIKLVARVKYDGRFDGLSNLQTLALSAGFNKSKLIPVIWELTPMSVFVDYFVNVGDILTASMVSTRDVISIDRYVTRTLIRRTVTRFDRTIYGVDILKSGETCIVQTHYVREKWSMSIPPLRFTTPADSVKQLTNLSAFVRLAFFN